MKQALQKFIAAHPDVRLIEPRFMEIRQAMGTAKGRLAGAAYLRSFIEEMKASGFVADALKRSGQHDAAVAPAEKFDIASEASNPASTDFWVARPPVKTWPYCLLIADEPTTALDVTVQAQILNLIKELKSRYGMAVILITHDLTIVRRFAEYVYVMQGGEVKEHNVTEKLFAAPRHSYTQHLLASEPKGIANPFPEHTPVILEGRSVRVAYTLKRGGMFKPDYFELVAVDNLDLKLQRHETLGLVGESGSGKTTFGQALIRLVTHGTGEIYFDGAPIHNKDRREMRPLRSRMQIVFQDPFASLNPRMSIRQTIEEGLIVNKIGADRAERLERVRQALRDAGLPDNILSRFPHEFSGGQRQRIAIARAIALDPEFILLDEPTSALDLSVQAQIIDLLRKLQREKGLSYLFISHDLKVVRALCHRVMVMQHGKVVEEGPVAEVLTRPKTAYTERLVKAAFEIAA